jgi:hypothetical protein
MKGINVDTHTIGASKGLTSRVVFVYMYVLASFSHYALVVYHHFVELYPWQRRCSPKDSIFPF